MFGIRSMRKTIEEIETILAYRWFLGFGFHDKVPHFSTFGKNYERRFNDADLFEQIFCEILNQAANKKLIKTEHVFIESTHVPTVQPKKIVIVSMYPIPSTLSISILLHSKKTIRR